MSDCAQHLLGYWNANPAYEGSDNRHGLLGIEFQADGKLLFVVPGPNFDDVLSFGYRIVASFIHTRSARTGRKGSFPYHLADDGALTIQLTDRAMHWMRANRLPDRPRRDWSERATLVNQGVSEERWTELRRQRSEWDDRLCAARGITRAQLQMEREL